MFNQLLFGLITVLLRVHYLFRKLIRSSAFENHFHIGWRQMPIWITRRSIQARYVSWLMAIGTFHGINPFAIFSSLWKHSMHMAIVTLKWNIARRMTIHTSRTH